MHELYQPQIGQGPDTCRGIGKTLAHLGPMTGLPIYCTHPIAGVRKGWRVLVALHEQVPTYVVAMQVRHHHHINVLRAHTMGFEIVHEFTPGSLRRINGFGTEPGVNQNGPPLRSYQERGEVEAHMMFLSEMSFIRLPLFL